MLIIKFIPFICKITFLVQITIKIIKYLSEILYDPLVKSHFLPIIELYQEYKLVRSKRYRRNQQSKEKEFNWIIPAKDFIDLESGITSESDFNPSNSSDENNLGSSNTSVEGEVKQIRKLINDKSPFKIPHTIPITIPTNKNIRVGPPPGFESDGETHDLIVYTPKPVLPEVELRFRFTIRFWEELLWYDENWFNLDEYESKSDFSESDFEYEHTCKSGSKESGNLEYQENERYSDDDIEYVGGSELVRFPANPQSISNDEMGIIRYQINNNSFFEAWLEEIDSEDDLDSSGFINEVEDDLKDPNSEDVILDQDDFENQENEYGDIERQSGNWINSENNVYVIGSLSDSDSDSELQSNYSEEMEEEDNLGQTYQSEIEEQQDGEHDGSNEDNPLSNGLSESTIALFGQMKSNPDSDSDSESNDSGEMEEEEYLIQTSETDEEEQQEEEKEEREEEEEEQEEAEASENDLNLNGMSESTNALFGQMNSAPELDCSRRTDEEDNLGQTCDSEQEEGEQDEDSSENKSNLNGLSESTKALFGAINSDSEPGPEPIYTQKIDEEDNLDRTHEFEEEQEQEQEQEQDGDGDGDGDDDGDESSKDEIDFNGMSESTNALFGQINSDSEFESDYSEEMAEEDNLSQTYGSEEEEEEEGKDLISSTFVSLNELNNDSSTEDEDEDSISESETDEEEGNDLISSVFAPLASQNDISDSDSVEENDNNVSLTSTSIKAGSKEGSGDIQDKIEQNSDDLLDIPTSPWLISSSSPSSSSSSLIPNTSSNSHSNSNMNSYSLQVQLAFQRQHPYLTETEIEIDNQQNEFIESQEREQIKRDLFGDRNYPIYRFDKPIPIRSTRSAMDLVENILVLRKRINESSSTSDFNLIF